MLRNNALVTSQNRIYFICKHVASSKHFSMDSNNQAEKEIKSVIDVPLKAPEKAAATNHSDKINWKGVNFLYVNILYRIAMII